MNKEDKAKTIELYLATLVAMMHKLGRNYMSEPVVYAGETYYVTVHKMPSE